MVIFVLLPQILCRVLQTCANRRRWETLLARLVRVAWSFGVPAILHIIIIIINLVRYSFSARNSFMFVCPVLNPKVILHSEVQPDFWKTARRGLFDSCGSLGSFRSLLVWRSKYPVASGMQGISLNVSWRNSAVGLPLLLNSMPDSKWVSEIEIDDRNT